MRLYSFDVFDTLLTRVWYQPRDLFFCVAEKLREQGIITGEIAAWVDLRMECERNARAQSSSEDTTLKEIYQHMGRKLEWPDDRCMLAMGLEESCEIAALRPVARTAQLLKHAVRTGRRVAYVSDMYLPSDLISHALICNGLPGEGQRLFVSSATGVTKHSGKMFSRLMEQMRFPRESIIHLGDNERSDGTVPRGLGMRATVFRDQKGNRYEDALYGSAEGSLVFRSLLAGCSRAARLQDPERARHRRVIWDTGCNVIGPVLFGFVHWVLESAARAGLSRLYFIARDGQILLRVAEFINKRWDYGISCRYLYGSRHAFHVPAITTVGAEELEWVFDATRFLSVRSVCDRVNLQPERIEGPLSASGFERAHWDEDLDGSARERLRACFEQPAVQSVVRSVAAENRTNALGYFKQEGLLDGGPIGMVDIGWNGRLQRSLGRVLELAGGAAPAIHGFYLGLLQNLVTRPDDQVRTYLIDCSTYHERNDLAMYRAAIELFVAADHGGTRYYQMGAGGTYEPVLSEPSNSAAIDWGLSAQQGGIVRFVDEFTASCARAEVRPGALLEVSSKLLRMFFTSPTRAEAEAYGAYRFFEDQTETLSYELSPVMGNGDFLRWFCTHRGGRIHRGSWIEGSLRRSRLRLRGLYAGIVRARRRLSRARVRYRSTRTSGMA